VNVACGEVAGFDETVFVNIYVELEAKGAGFLAVGGSFNDPCCIGVLGVVALSFLGRARWASITRSSMMLTLPCLMSWPLVWC
jgi:hypothetical protein